MGPNMLIMGASYRHRTRFARPIYDLAAAIGAANLPRGARRPEWPQHSQTAVRTRKRFIARQKYTTSIALTSPSVQTDPPGFGSISFFEMLGPLPPRQKR